ncbi:MAG TPA: hypothetical protein GXZ65_02755 [Clostridiales bacterium]|jgi:hypothetical protein|nr:hypothetical protein [Clostridiales bacterium]
MAKAGMRRPDPEERHGTEGGQAIHLKKNRLRPVPEIKGKAKHGKAKAR